MRGLGWRARYSFAAHTISPLRERWCSRALARKAAATSAGKRTVILMSCSDVFMTLYYHIHSAMTNDKTPDGVRLSSPAPLGTGLQPRSSLNFLQWRNDAPFVASNIAPRHCVSLVLFSNPLIWNVLLVALASLLAAIPREKTETRKCLFSLSGFARSCALEDRSFYRRRRHPVCMRNL